MTKNTRCTFDHWFYSIWTTAAAWRRNKVSFCQFDNDIIFVNKNFSFSQLFLLQRVPDCISYKIFWIFWEQWGVKSEVEWGFKPIWVSSNRINIKSDKSWGENFSLMRLNEIMKLEKKRFWSFLTIKAILNTKLKAFNIYAASWKRLLGRQQVAAHFH